MESGGERDVFFFADHVFWDLVALFGERGALILDQRQTGINPPPLLMKAVSLVSK
jgi:hypothetical protein